jgi:hypothetical protein
VFEALQHLLAWLAVPLRTAQPVESPNSSFSRWASRGPACLVVLLGGADWQGELGPVAALLQGITLATADELASRH